MTLIVIYFVFTEALNLANQLCQFGYFFPVSDSKNLVVKDDSSLYRFQVNQFRFCVWNNNTMYNLQLYFVVTKLKSKVIKFNENNFHNFKFEFITHEMQYILLFHEIEN